MLPLEAVSQANINPSAKIGHLLLGVVRLGPKTIQAIGIALDCHQNKVTRPYCCRTQRNQAGNELEVSSLQTSFHGARSYCPGY